MFLRALRDAGRLPVTAAGRRRRAGRARARARDGRRRSIEEQLAPAIARVWHDEIAAIGRDLRGGCDSCPKQKAGRRRVRAASACRTRGATAQHRDAVPRRPLRPARVDRPDRARRTGPRSCGSPTTRPAGTAPTPRTRDRRRRDAAAGALRPRGRAAARPAGGGGAAVLLHGGRRLHRAPGAARRRQPPRRPRGARDHRSRDRAGFLPPAPAERACTWCDFRPVCGPDERAARARKPPTRSAISTRCGGCRDRDRALVRCCRPARPIATGARRDAGRRGGGRHRQDHGAGRADRRACSPRAAPTVDEIVAVTFTEKAAGEMKLRLREELERERAPTAERRPERAPRSTRRCQLEDAHISTIHGFCADLLRERPVEARVDPLFEVLTEPQAGAAVRRGVRRAGCRAARRSARRRAARAAPDAPSAATTTARRAAAQRGVGAGRVARLPAPWRREPFDRAAADDRSRCSHERARVRRASPASRRQRTIRCTPTPSRRGALSDEIGCSRLRRCRGRTTTTAGGRAGRPVARSRTRRRPARAAAPIYAEGVTRDARPRGARAAAIAPLDQLPEAMPTPTSRRCCSRSCAVPRALRGAQGARRRARLPRPAAPRARPGARQRRRCARLQARFTRIFVDEFQDTDPLQAEILLLLAADDRRRDRLARACGRCRASCSWSAIRSSRSTGSAAPTSALPEVSEQLAAQRRAAAAARRRASAACRRSSGVNAAFAAGDDRRRR